MKNVFMYYYNLTPINIHQKDKNFYFESDDNKYKFVLVNKFIDDIKNLYIISSYLFQNGFYIDQIIPNKDKQFITNINGKNYILLKIYIDRKDEITINDINVFNYFFLDEKVLKIKYINWYELWIKKIDYFEYQISQLGKKYPLIRESFSYYVGLTENAIALVRNVKNPRIVIAHNRINIDKDVNELYNPLNFVYDSRVRDISEYYKSMFFNKKISKEELLNEIEEYIIKNNLNNDEIIMLFSRFLYPSYYFDIYEDIIQNNVDEKSLLKIINLITEYENFIKELYLYLRKIIVFPEIEWLETM